MTGAHPCGTIAAARRHYRRHEVIDFECRQAMARDVADRAGRPGAPMLLDDPRIIRNGLPWWRPYYWRDPARVTPERAAELARIDELEAILDGLQETA